MNHEAFALMTDEDWINQGKVDAWAGKPKQTPEHDPQAASMYDLGYCEGEISVTRSNTRGVSPVKKTKVDRGNQ